MQPQSDPCLQPFPSPYALRAARRHVRQIQAHAQAREETDFRNTIAALYVRRKQSERVNRFVALAITVAVTAAWLALVLTWEQASR